MGLRAARARAPHPAAQLPHASSANSPRTAGVSRRKDALSVRRSRCVRRSGPASTGSSCTARRLRRRRDRARCRGCWRRVRHGRDDVMLDDGSEGMVPEEWLQPLCAGSPERGRRRAITSASGRRRRRCSTPRWRASRPSVDEKFLPRARRAAVVQRRHRAARAARSFAGTLRDYQRDALGWFAFLRRFGFGGCLADDMGLGKTVMVLAWLDALRADARVDRALARRRAAIGRLQLDGGGARGSRRS